MKSHLIVFVCLLIIFLPTVVFGALDAGGAAGAGDGGALGDLPAFIPLVGIPGIDENKPGLEIYINAIYRLAISLAALLAVVKIVIAGAKYMLDDIVTHKEEAKQDIWGALMGLLVIIAAVVILNTINSDLTKTSLLLTPVTIEKPLNTPENLLASCQNEDGCVLQICTDNAIILPGISEFLPEGTERTCAAHCTIAGGVHYKFNDQAYTRCAVNGKKIDELKDAYRSQLVNRLCPEGQECYVETCDIYGKDYSILSGSTCANICTTTYFGKYDSTTKNCVMHGNETAVTKNITCTGVKYLYQGTVVDGRCTSASEQCYNDGGYAVNSDGVNLTCRTPKFPTLSCPEGQNLVTKDTADCVDGFCTQTTVCE